MFVFCIKQILSEGMIVVTKNASKFFFQVYIGIAFLTIVFFRGYLIVIENYIVEDFSKNQFLDYFPTNYIVVKFETPVRTIEMITTYVLIVNIYNMFYFQFWEQIFLTFKKAAKKFFSFSIIFFIIVLGFACVNTYLFGPYIDSKYITTYILIYLFTYYILIIF